MSDTRPFSDLRPTGLLWLINATVFHPRGYALALHWPGVSREGEPDGWVLLGNGKEPWYFSHEPPSDEERAKYAAMSVDELFAAAKSLMP